MTFRVIVEQEVDAFEVFNGADEGWAFFTLALEMMAPFESEAAARSACARLREMWPALIHGPEGLYQPFQTSGEGWGFFDRAGQLHAGFCGFQAAMETVEQIEHSSPESTPC